MSRSLGRYKRTGAGFDAGVSVRVEEYSGLESLPRDARNLLDDAVHYNPFVSRPWMENFERHLVRPHESPRYLTAITDDGPCAVLPLLLERRGILGLVRLRAMSNFYTGIFETAGDSSSMRPELKNSIATALSAHIARMYSRIPLVEFAPIRDDDGLCANTVKGLGIRRYATRRYVVHGNWYEDVAGLDFESYMSRRPGKVRSTLERKRRKLARETNCEFDICSDSTSIKQHMHEFRSIYQASWKTPELSSAFIEDVMSALAIHDIVVLGVLRVGDTPAAAQLWIRIRNWWAVFKLAYDPAFQGYSVGTILMAHMIESFFSKGRFDGLDFLSGDDEYKREWVGSRRAHWGFEAISGRSPVGWGLQLKRRLAGVAFTR